MPRALNGDGEGALTLRGKTGLATRFDLATLREKPAQAGDILVVNLINAIGGKDVHAATTTATATETTTAAAAAAKSATAAAATAKSATATTITAEPATAATAVTTMIIGTGGAVITRRALIRCPLRALLVSHGLFLLMCIR